MDTVYVDLRSWHSVAKQDDQKKSEIWGQEVPTNACDSEVCNSEVPNPLQSVSLGRLDQVLRCMRWRRSGSPTDCVGALSVWGLGMSCPDRSSQLQHAPLSSSLCAQMATVDAMHPQLWFRHAGKNCDDFGGGKTWRQEMSVTRGPGMQQAQMPY